MRFILLIFLVLAPAYAQPTKPIKTALFEATVPTGWEERLTDTALYLLYPGKDVSDPEHAHISITPTRVSSGMSLDSFTFMAKHTVENDYPELQLGYSRPTMLGKLEAHRFEYRGLRSGKKFTLVQVMAITGKSGYTVEYRGSEADFLSLRNAFDLMLKSFKSL